MTNLLKKWAILCVAAMLATSAMAGGGAFSDTTRAYAVPTLTKTPSGEVAMSWTEKANDGTVYFYWAKSGDNGRTFGDKKLIYASAGISNSRLMRPKLLFRPDGTPIAVFGLRNTEATAPVAATSAPAAEHAGHDAHGNHGEQKAEAPKAPQGGRGGGRPRSQQIVYATSADGGNTWTQPAPVHTDKTPNIMRGFFDAAVLANGEVAVTWLNDVPGDEHEQRDLRFVTSTGGKFGTERTIDPYVCACCNISLLVDKAGTLHVYYRENDKNIRDIAEMRSTNNGATFSKPQILSKDNWQINGCPHSGPTASANGSNPLVAWFSGSTDAPGIRLVNEQGKRLFVVSEPTAKNPYLAPAPQSSVLLWEQSQPSESGMTSVIAYRTVSAGATSDTQVVKGAANATNASGIVVDAKLVVAYEVRKPNNKNGLEWTTVSL